MALMLAGDALADLDFRITQCNAAEECLALFTGDAPEELPDLILLDIEMPGMDGYQACKQLRECGLEDTQVIFVSGHDDLESRLACYDAGGNDFIVKPYAPKELLYQVKRIQEVISQREALTEQFSFAQQTAFTAISSLGEMGAVLQFIRDSFVCNDYQDLAGKIFAVTQAYGLTAMVDLRDAEDHYSFSQQSTCGQLEISILQHIRTMGRIQQRGERLIINFPNVSMLVLDLPTDEPERAERLRDHLAIMAEGAQSRMLSLIAEAERNAQARGILAAAARLTSSFKEIEALQDEHRGAALNVASSFQEKLLDAFIIMGLTDQQEAQLIELADESMKQIVELMNNQALLGERLWDVSSALERLASRELVSNLLQAAARTRGKESNDASPAV